MSFSEFLQKEKLFRTASDCSPSKLKKEITELGFQWFRDNPSATEAIENNLRAFGFDPAASLISDFQYHLSLHYYEKFLGICLKPSEYREYLRERIDGIEAINLLQNSLQKTRGIFVTTCHFGAVEFIVPYLSSFMLPVSAVLRFKTQMLSETVHKRAQQMASGGDFGSIGFIEIGKPGSAVALEMAAVLRRKEILLSIFDEKTEYSKPVKLLNREVWGGAGVDRITRFCGSEVDLFAAFMQRTGEETYKLMLHKADPEQPVESMFSCLEKFAGTNPEQWYFLHEEIPFVE